jgi:hypothetical protein
MTEHSIKKLGFERCVVEKEEIELNVDIHYYTYNVGSVCFISNDSLSKQDTGIWTVEIPGSDVVFNDVKELKCVIDCLERNVV